MEEKAPALKTGGINDTSTGAGTSIISLLKQFVEVNTYNFFLNIGRTKNDGKYHLYDLTSDIKNKRIAGRESGLSGPVGNRITNDSSNSSIFAEGKNVNSYSAEDEAPGDSYSYAGEGAETAEERKNTRPDIDRADVVFADSYSVEEELSYDSLIKKPNMVLTQVKSADGMSRSDIVSEGFTNAASVGYMNEHDVPVVFINDISKEIKITNNGLRHGLRRKYSENGTVTRKAGEIIKNSIKINELRGREKNQNGSYVLIGAARDGDTLYIVRSIVSKSNLELSQMDTLYAINAKKESAALNAPSPRVSPLHFTDSEITISELLEYVNKYFPDVLPADVLKHFGRTTRPESAISADVVYSVEDEGPEMVSTEEAQRGKHFTYIRPP